MWPHAAISADGDSLMIRLHDENVTPFAQAVDYQFTIGSGTPTPGTSPDGWVTVPLPTDSCPDRIHIEWGAKRPDGTFPFAQDIFVDCDDGQERAQAGNKLSNLGYAAGSDDQYLQAVLQFQQDYAIAEKGLGDGGQLQPQTHDKLWSLFDSDCDATRPPPPSTPPPSSAPPSQSDVSDGTGSCFSYED